MEIKDVVLNGHCGLLVFHRKVRPFILGKDWDQNTFTEVIEVDEYSTSKQISAAIRGESVYVAFPKPGYLNRLHIMKSYPATASDMNFEYVENTRVHESPIACLAMSHDGSLIATTSEKGTLIRIFDLEINLLREIRRSIVRPANTISMVFSECQNFLCCSFDSQTVHIINLLEIESYEAIQHYKNNSYYEWFVKSPLTDVCKAVTGYNIDTVACSRADMTFKCESKCPVILSVEFDEILSTLKIIIDEGFGMPEHAYKCDLIGMGSPWKIDFEDKK